MTMYCMMLITTPDKNTATDIAQKLVEQQLAACVNIVPAVQSVYRWKGKVTSDQEILLMVKTQSSLFENVSKAVKEMHPYEIPEIISLPIQNGSEAYLKWIEESLRK